MPITTIEELYKQIPANPDALPIVGYVKSNAPIGIGLEIKTPIYDTFYDPLKVPNCKMVLIKFLGSFMWIRHRTEHIFLGKEAVAEIETLLNRLKH